MSTIQPAGTMARILSLHQNVEGLFWAVTSEQRKVLPPAVVVNGQDDSSQEDEGAETGLITRPKSRAAPKTQKPSMYRVVLLNDDFTPMEFVIHILQKFFQKDHDEATRIMLQVHQHGSGVAGIFTYDIAETKVYQVNQYARTHKHPLKSTMERV